MDRRVHRFACSDAPSIDTAYCTQISVAFEVRCAVRTMYRLTLSEKQYEFAAQRVQEAGLTDRVEIGFRIAGISTVSWIASPVWARSSMSGARPRDRNESWNHIDGPRYRLVASR